ncbi:DNA repair protein complementing XP-C cells homolog [Wyeomyia smithii]|uniref:DNA repair protein complementing XP-C cells homolog n=1 Tax=Wyeomyia smithii TaxID=174621 RepID=UPI002467F4B9|nr:DNA repair protein complementing XP-C cells homolog [Wyeomyia smithii]
MSDDLGSDSEKEEEDFSASEDEWLPVKASRKCTASGQKRDQYAMDYESSDSDSDSGDEKDLPVYKNVRKKNCVTEGRSNIRPSVKMKLTSSERKSLYEKYRSKITDAKNVKQRDGDSESSGDEHLVNPDQLDLSSDFFKAAPSDAGPSKQACPSFDCNAGMHLSDSSEGEGENGKLSVDRSAEAKRDTNRKLISNINKNSTSFVQFEGLNEFNRIVEQAKERASSFNFMQAATDNSTDIGVLLAMGEHHPEEKRKKSKSNFERNSDSDWEEVLSRDGAQKQSDVQVTFNLETSSVTQKKKQSADIDMEACIKRVINREKRENQIVLHKVNILMAIGHGNFVNAALNNTKLLALALTMIPSQKCYPKDRTNLAYFEQILKFYRQIVDLKDKRMYCRFKKLPSLATSLRLQMLTKAAICKRDYILIFIILLRAIGVQCRLVMSLVVAPRKPPQSELFQPPKATAASSSGLKQNSERVLGGVRKDVIPSDKAKKKKEEPEEKSRVKSSKRKPNETVSVPQLDGGDDIPVKKTKLEATKRKLADSSAISEKLATNSIETTLFSPRKTRKQRQNETKNSQNAQVKQSREIPSHSSATSIEKHNSNKSTEPNELLKSKTSSQKPKQCKPSSTQTSQSMAKDGTINDIKIKPESSSVSKTKSSSSKSFKSTPPANKIVKIEYVDKHIKRRLDRRVLSTDNECKSNSIPLKSKSTVNVWIEVYAEEEEQWIPVDVTSGKVHCLEHIVKNASSPLVYILAWNNDSTIKDVTTRYCSNYATSTKKLRVEQDWLDETLRKFKGKRSARDIEEDRCLNQAMMEQPLPTAIGEYKNHPLYALKRHLLKFEAIYPPEAPTLGFIRDEPVYARECVHTLHSREIWLKQARTVKLFETAYKVVNARPKYDRASGKMLAAQPLELYGYWQTQDYEPPTAEDGIVPRNAYGNVELFKPCMLPKKTVHLQLPGLNRICKKLGIDCAQAVTGFDFHGGSSHPVYDGFVVCEEYKDLVVDAWYQEQEEDEKREREKYEKRVYGNWKKLIKGLLIRRKLQNKYNFDNLSG